MFQDVSQCNTYNYGDASYWDARYLEDGVAAFDWYQCYSALRPFVRKFVPASSRVLMVGCGNAFMSEDMVKDGYTKIVNIDISSVVIDMLKVKYALIPQLTCILIPAVKNEKSVVHISVTIKVRIKTLLFDFLKVTDEQMDVRDMSCFQDESFDCVIDKGTLDSLMCGTDAPLSASQMLEEVSRLLRPGGTYMLITYGDPSVRIPHLKREGYNWKITLYIISRPEFVSRTGNSSSKSILEPVILTEEGQLPSDFVLEDPDSHYIYVCTKMDELSNTQPDSNVSKMSSSNCVVL